MQSPLTLTTLLLFSASPEALDPKQTLPPRKDGADEALLVHWTTTVPPNVGNGMHRQNKWCLTPNYNVTTT